jgi:cold shock protein
MSDQERIPEVNGNLTGTVKWFDTKKAFGFIELPDGGADIFVHVNQLRKSGINRVLHEGEKVSFKTNKGPKGNFAVDISVISTAPRTPEPGEA